MKRILYLASKNPGKIKEYQNLLSEVNCELVLQPNTIDVQESGQTFRENALKKAYEIASKMKNYAIADDSGLCINALNGRPGIYSSRYAENDKERINRVLSELEGETNRRAFFIANICLVSPKGELVLDVEAKCYGNILLNSRGLNGFGYDPIFEEVSTKLTFAEMTDEIKDKLSHRGKAISKIIPKLIQQFPDD
tara:strand:+ start:60 stop:644 length:585 start_codon:yes stop_codon:yes gene_type:complete